MSKWYDRPVHIDDSLRTVPQGMRVPVFQVPKEPGALVFVGALDLSIGSTRLMDCMRDGREIKLLVLPDSREPIGPAEVPLNMHFAYFRPMSIHHTIGTRGGHASNWVLFTDAPMKDLLRINGFHDDMPKMQLTEEEQQLVLNDRRRRELDACDWSKQPIVSDRDLALMSPHTAFTLRNDKYWVRDECCLCYRNMRHPSSIVWATRVSTDAQDTQG